MVLTQGPVAPALSCHSGHLHKKPEIFHTQNILWLEVPLPHTEYSVTWSSTVPLPHNECAVTWSTVVLIPHTAYSLPGETGVDYGLEPTTWFRMVGKELCFHKIGPIMMPKSIGYKIFTIFLICVCERQDDQNRYSRFHEIHFRTRRVRYTSRRQVLDHSRLKANLCNSVYNVPRKISICLPEGSNNIYWGIGPVQMLIVVWKNIMPHGKKRWKKVFAPWLTARKKVLAPWHSIFFPPYYETNYFILR